MHIEKPFDEYAVSTGGGGGGNPPPPVLFPLNVLEFQRGPTAISGNTGLFLPANSLIIAIVFSHTTPNLESALDVGVSLSIVGQPNGFLMPHSGSYNAGTPESMGRFIFIPAISEVTVIGDSDAESGGFLKFKIVYLTLNSF